jgi:PAS domain-containing protein
MTLFNDPLNTNEELSARLSSIINNLPAGVCILKGPEFVLEEVNDGMLKIWGRDRSITGKRLLEFMPELSEQAFPVLLTASVYNGSSTY